MIRAVRIDRTGGPEVMALREVDLDPPGPGMVRVANRAVGLNYIDTYHRGGLYHQLLQFAFVGRLGAVKSGWPVIAIHIDPIQGEPREIVTDKPRSCGVVHRGLIPAMIHRRKRY